MTTFPTTSKVPVVYEALFDLATAAVGRDARVFYGYTAAKHSAPTEVFIGDVTPWAQTSATLPRIQRAEEFTVDIVVQSRAATTKAAMDKTFTAFGLIETALRATDPFGLASSGVLFVDMAPSAATTTYEGNQFRSTITAGVSVKARI